MGCKKKREVIPTILTIS